MSDDARTHPWWASFPALLVVASAQALVLVPWRYLASEDGPTNLASARMIANYPGAYRTYFTLDFLPKFNTLWQLLLVVPTSVLPPLVGERLMVVLLVIALPVAGWYAATGVRAGAGPVAFFLLPVSIGYFFHAGYYGFCLGLVLGLVTLGWWLRHRDGGLGSWLVLAGLLVLTYLCHIVAAGMVVLLLAVVTLWEMVTGDRSSSLHRLLRLALAAVPFVALFVTYAAVGQGGPGGIGFENPFKLVAGLLSFWEITVSMNRVEVVFSTLLAVTLGLLALFFLRQAPRRVASPAHAWLVAALVALALYFLSPNSIHGGDTINARILLFVVFSTLLWFATFPFSRRITAIMVASALVIAGGLTLLHVPKYVGFDRDLREYAQAGDHLPEGSTVLAVNLAIPTDGRPGLTYSRSIRPIIQASGYLVAEHKVVDLSHFMGRFGWFITRFRPDMDPFEIIGHGVNWLDDTTPELNILDYPKLTGGRGSIDYVIVWGANVAPQDVTSSPEVRDLGRQLDSAYDLVFTSSRGHLQLYKLRDSG